MSSFLKCECSHCGQHIEFPDEGMGQTIPCPTCRLETRLLQFVKSRCYQCGGGIVFSENGVGHKVNCPHCGHRTKLGLNPFASALLEGGQELLQVFKCEPPATVISPPQKRAVRIKLANLTEETIRSRTKVGDTPLHRAARNGQLSEIPRHLLNVELFMVTNYSGNTPLHIAAKYGHLNQVPRQFLIKETLTITTPYFNGSVYVATNTTVLHNAAYHCADQIPQEFLTPEFLSIDVGGYGNTVLHSLAEANRLRLVPEIYAHSEMWKLKNSSGLTPREIPIKKAEAVAAKAERDAWRPSRASLPIQHDPSKLLPVFTKELLRSIEVKSTDQTKTYIVNLLDYTCSCPLCQEIYSEVPARDFGRLCKHLIIALREKHLVGRLPPIARGIVENGLPFDAFGVYPGRFAEDLYGRPIYITGKNYDGWINVFAIWRRKGVSYSRFGYNANSRRWFIKNLSYFYLPEIDESLLY